METEPRLSPGKPCMAKNPLAPLGLELAPWPLLAPTPVPSSTPKLSCHGSGRDKGNSAPRRPREVTLKSREPTRTQTFHRDGGLGAEARAEGSSVPFHEAGAHRAVVAGMVEGTDLAMTDVHPLEAMAGPESNPVPSRPAKMIQSKLGMLGETCEASRGFERQTGTARGTSASWNGLTPGVLGTNPEEQLQVIDDCPPLPPPFEHRIVSAKQVPVCTYYTIKPDQVLGGGRFGQVHKCTELTSGLTLAAKIIKVKGMMDRDEVKNKICVMNQLDHVNLIQLYDAFESHTNLTLVME